MIDRDTSEVEPPLPPGPDFPPPSQSGFGLVVLMSGIGLAVGMLAVALSSGGHPQFLALLESTRIASPVGVLMFLLAIGSKVVMHEAAHAIAALLVGWNIRAISLGPLRAFRRSDGWQFRFQRTRVVGSVLALPNGLRGTLTIPHLRGGWATGGNHRDLWRSDGVLGVQVDGALGSYLASVLLLGIFSVPAALIPNSKSAKIWNDARTNPALLSNDKEAVARIITLQVLHFVLGGAHPRAYPLELVRAAAQFGRTPEAAAIHACFIADWARDRGDLSSAFAWSERSDILAESCWAALKNSLRAGCASFDLAWRRDIGAARKRLEGGQPENSFDTLVSA